MSGAYMQAFQATGLEKGAGAAFRSFCQSKMKRSRKARSNVRTRAKHYTHLLQVKGVEQTFRSRCAEACIRTQV